MIIAWVDPNVNRSILVKRQVHHFLARGNALLIQPDIVGVIFMMFVIKPKYAKIPVADNDVILFQRSQEGRDPHGSWISRKKCTASSRQGQQGIFSIRSPR